MKYLVITDLHIGAPNSISNLDFLIKSAKEARSLGYTTVYLGDNIDLANCENRSVTSYREILLLIKDLFDIFITGNHERAESDRSLFAKIKSGPNYSKDSIIWSHGDYEFWGNEKAANYRAKPQGASFFKRGVVVKSIEIFERKFDSKIDNYFLINALNLAKSNKCNIYICGHKHNEILYDKIVDNIQVFVLPRGYFWIEIVDNKVQFLGDERFNWK